MNDIAFVRRSWTLSLVVSLASVLVAVLWLTVPDTYPYGSGDIARVGVNHLIERVPAAAMLSMSAMVGIGLAAIVLRGNVTRATGRVVAIGAGAEALFFAFVMSDAAVMSSLGYVVALTAPVGVAGLVVLVCRSWPFAGLVVVSLVLVAGAVGLASGALSSAADAVGTYLGGFLSDPEGDYVRIVWSLGMAAAAACWAWAAVASALGRTSASWASVRKWGRAVTIAAALGPVPYGLIRLTWLTPWPLGGHGIEEFVISHELTGPERIQGGLFALAAGVGVVLTLGLISRWGEVFPRWVPVLGGAAVPVRLAVVPGALVAAAITISAPGMVVMAVESGDPREVALTLFFFPFPLWGPLLGAAVLAYWVRRTR